MQTELYSLTLEKLGPFLLKAATQLEEIQDKSQGLVTLFLRRFSRGPPRKPCPWPQVSGSSCLSLPHHHLLSCWHLQDPDHLAGPLFN